MDFINISQYIDYNSHIDVIVLIIMNFLANNIIIFKFIIYIAFPLTTYFLLSSYNIITTICKMISSEEKSKSNKSHILSMFLIKIHI